MKILSKKQGYLQYSNSEVEIIKYPQENQMSFTKVTTRRGASDDGYSKEYHFGKVLNCLIYPVRIKVDDAIFEEASVTISDDLNILSDCTEEAKATINITKYFETLHEIPCIVKLYDINHVKGDKWRCSVDLRLKEV